MTFALLAAPASPEPLETRRQETSLGVSATVVRPVEVAASLADAADGVIVLRNTESVDVQVSGASVTQPEAGTTLVTSDGTGVVAITLIF